MVFINLGKMHNRVPTKIILWVIEKKWLSSRYNDLVKDIFDGTVSSINTIEGDMINHSKFIPRPALNTCL